jgi:hypothetical protein
MDLQLSWDLFVMVMFVIIVAYSLIIGTNNTLKVILATYVAAIASDATGNMLKGLIGSSPTLESILEIASVSGESESIVFIKVLCFVGMVILFAVKGAFDVETIEDRSTPVRMIVNVMYAVASAGMIISVILVFVSGVSFVGGGNPVTTGTALYDIYTNSRFINSIISNTYLWFAMPAFAFLVHSWLSRKSE